MAQDSSLPEFWNTRYASNVTPWDAGDTPPDLIAHADARTDRPHALIPGCGSAYEARFLVGRGWDVLAIDFSDAALERARDTLGPYAAAARKADFFAAIEGEPFDVVYERALLCALPPRTWPQYASRVATLVRPGGDLAGFFFFGATDRGPPFAIEPAALDGLLGGAFERVEHRLVERSISIFHGREFWQVWRRR
jgi:hypothetical protein